MDSQETKQPWHGFDRYSFPCRDTIQWIMKQTQDYMLSHNGSLPHVECIEDSFQPSAEDLQTMTGQVVVVTDYVQGNYKFSAYAVSLVPREWHEFLLSVRAQFDFFDTTVNDMFHLDYATSGGDYGVMINELITEPLAMWKAIKRRRPAEMNVHNADVMRLVRDKLFEDEDFKEQVEAWKQGRRKRKLDD